MEKQIWYFDAMTRTWRKNSMLAVRLMILMGRKDILIAKAK